MKKPLIAIPMGDPAGIGPEIVVKALADAGLRQLARPLVIGDRQTLADTLATVGSPLLLTPVSRSDRVGDDPARLWLLDPGGVLQEKIQAGQVSAAAGRAAFRCFEKSLGLALSGELAAIATPPISKEALLAAGIPFIGHTEILAHFCAVPDPLTLFQVRNLRVFFLSRHVSLRQACDLVNRERILQTVPRVFAALRRLGVSDGHLAVAGLNPHNGEGGRFGVEEQREVLPAVLELQRQGLRVSGPVAADAVFHLALQGHFDAVLSLYHDQGHIATKTVDFERTVSLTCGLPFLRTSVDHGTAFDIAGKNQASPVSLIEAIRLAALYAPCFS